VRDWLRETLTSETNQLRRGGRGLFAVLRKGTTHPGKEKRAELRPVGLPRAGGTWKKALAACRKRESKRAVRRLV